MSIVATYLLKLALPAAVAAQACCLQGSLNDAEFDRYCNDRLNSAAQLTSAASDLIHRNQSLEEQIKICQTITTTQEAKDKFSTTLDDYQAARQKYLDHRQLYDLHVKEFHKQPKADNRPLPPLAVPNVKPIAIAAEDACTQLQAMEQQLKQSEEQLCKMIQTLQSEKGKIPEETYFQNWMNTQSMAMSVQNGALEFNRGVATKGVNSSNQAHAASEAANVSGDYVQSKKAYAFVQASTAIENEETQRAHLHSNLASQCFIYINALNPNSTTGGGSSTITADQLVKESSALQTEYDDLQSKYSSMQNANPAHN